jgi:DNA-binding MarR family transcriptional regulator/GNAT superfamily N-acetyltransferase
MDDTAIARVRRFNRTVTQCVGALDERYLARGRPLGAARVLWEIGQDGCDVRSLRSRLSLDSGYLSRLLRSLEADRLVSVGVGATDRRARTARLTAKGRAERELLDTRSDALARSLLDPLTERQRQRLAAAMAEVQALLTAALVQVDVVDPADPPAQHCLHEYFAELGRRFPAGFDPGLALPSELDAMRPPAGVFLVATLLGEPVGCGGLKLRPDQPADVKRMWVAPSARGLGLGRRMLTELEARAAGSGRDRIRLETNGALTEAIAMYRSSGYRDVAAFNDEPYAELWFEKRLDRLSRAAADEGRDGPDGRRRHAPTPDRP